MSLLDLFMLIRKRIAVMVVVPVLFGVAGLVVAYGLMSDEYTATAVFNAVESPSEAVVSKDTDTSRLQVLVNDVAQLANSDRVAEGVAASLGVSLDDGYSVKATTSPNSRTIVLTVDGEDPELAALLANTIVETISSLSSDLGGVEGIEKVKEASVPTSPSGLPRILYVFVALFVGLFVALVLIMVMDLLDASVRDGDEAELLSKMHAIGSLPVAAKAREFGLENASLSQTCEAAAEILFANVRIACKGEEPSVLVFTSSSPNEGAEYASYYFSKTLGHVGKRVILVDCDARGRGLSRKLLQHDNGLFAMCSGGDASSAVEGLEHGFDFVGIERDLPNPVDLYMSKSFADVLDSFRVSYDYIVFCTPSVGSYADASILSSYADLTVMTVRPECVKRDDLERSSAQLRRAGAKAAGICIMENPAD